MGLPRPTPQRVTGPGGAVVVWASDVPALRTFFPSSTALSSLPPPPKNVGISGSSARQYPGDTTLVSRAAGTRQIYPERSLSNGTTPGKPFWCETTSTGPDGKAVKTRKQFTFQGAFGDLKAAARVAATRTFVLRSPNGSAYQIVKAAPLLNPLAENEQRFSQEDLSY